MFVAIVAAPGLLRAASTDPATNSEAPVEAPEEEAAEPIPVDQIGVAAARTKRTVADLSKKLKAGDAAGEVEQLLPERTEQVEELLARSAAFQNERMNLVMIDQLRQEWRVLGADVDEAQVALGRRAAEIRSLRDSLQADFDVWTETRKAATKSAEGREVTVLIDATIADLEQALKTARSRQGDLAALQGRVARLTEASASDVAALMELRRGLVGKVFEQDSPAAWSPAFYERLTGGEILQRLREHRDRDLIGLSRFAQTNRDRLVMHLLATLALIPLMFSARARIRLIDEDGEDGERGEHGEAVAHMRAVFDRPIALALLLSAFVGYWGYVDIPPLASPVIGAMLLLPAVLILRRLLDPPIFPILNMLLVLFFVDLLIEAVAPLPGVPRLVFVAEMAAVFVVVMWWRRPRRLGDLSLGDRSSTAFQWIGFGLRLATVAAPVAIMAEIAGFTALARTVGGTMLTAGYSAVILYGAARALDGVVAGLLRVPPLRRLGMVQRQSALIADHLETYTRWLVTGLYVYVLLGRLEVVDRVWELLQATWNAEIPLISMGVTLGSIVEFLVVLRLTFALSSFVQFILDEEVYTRVRMPKGQPYSISTLTKYTVLTLGFTVALFALGLDVNRFTVLAGAFGVGIGFGLQTIVNNFVSGLILLTERPVQVGDTVQLEGPNGVFGEVQRIGIRSSTVRTWQGAEVIVPNAQLISEQVTNWTLTDDKRRIEIPVGVAYGTAPPLVLELLKAVARSNPAILDDPAPTAFFMNFGDSALEFELRCWTDQPDRFMGVRSEVAVGVEAALREAGVTVPFPQRDLHLRTVPVSHPADRTPSMASDDEKG